MATSRSPAEVMSRSWGMSLPEALSRSRSMPTASSSERASHGRQRNRTSSSMPAARHGSAAWP
ncbi:MAG: hypothetical protein ACK55Z_08090 [bacterium]